MIRKVKNYILVLFCFVFTFCICLNFSNATDQGMDHMMRTINRDNNNVGLAAPVIYQQKIDAGNEQSSSIPNNNRAGGNKKNSKNQKGDNIEKSVSITQEEMFEKTSSMADDLKASDNKIAELEKKLEKQQKAMKNLQDQVQDQQQVINKQKAEIDQKDQKIDELQSKAKQEQTSDQRSEVAKADNNYILSGGTSVQASDSKSLANQDSQNKNNVKNEKNTGSSKDKDDKENKENKGNNGIVNHNLSLQNNYFASSGITYNPSIDISSSILDSNDFIYFGDNYNIEGDNVNIKLGFNYTDNTKHSISNNFNKYIVFNPQIEGFNNLYFSVVNYYDLFSKSNVNSMDLRKNYYTLYTKFKLNGISNLYLGFGYGYIPFEKNTNEIKNNKKGHFNKYTLFAILNTSIDVEEAEDTTLINRLGFDINILSSNYRLNEDTSNVYLKLKDSILVNTLVDADTDLFAGLNFGLFNTNREFLKKIGLTDTFEYGITGGVKFEYGTIGISCGNLGFGLNFGINY